METRQFRDDEASLSVSVVVTETTKTSFLTKFGHVIAIIVWTLMEVLKY